MATQIIKNQPARVQELEQGNVPVAEAAKAGLHELAKQETGQGEAAGLRQQAARLSQQASMAEVATTALHNVGNVLNSVNVSASLVTQRLRESRVHNLGKALALLREHSAHLGAFLTEDPKGRMLPGYLETLAEHLTAEHAELLREMDALTRSLDHMKESLELPLVQRPLDCDNARGNNKGTGRS